MSFWSNADLTKNPLGYCGSSRRTSTSGFTVWVDTCTQPRAANATNTSAPSSFAQSRGSRPRAAARFVFVARYTPSGESSNASVTSTTPSRVSGGHFHNFSRPLCTCVAVTIAGGLERDAGSDASHPRTTSTGKVCAAPSRNVSPIRRRRSATVT